MPTPLSPGKRTSSSARGGWCRPRALRGQGPSWPPVGSRVPLPCPPGVFLGSHKALEVEGRGRQCPVSHPRPRGAGVESICVEFWSSKQQAGQWVFRSVPLHHRCQELYKSILALTCVSSLKPRTRNSGHRPGAGTETGLLPQGIPWGQTLSLRLFPHLAAVPCSPESLVICRKGRSLSRRLSLHSQTTSRDPGTVTLIQSVNKPLFASPCFGQMLD